MARDHKKWLIKHIGNVCHHFKGINLNHEDTVIRLINNFEWRVFELHNQGSIKGNLLFIKSIIKGDSGYYLVVMFIDNIISMIDDGEDISQFIYRDKKIKYSDNRELYKPK